MICLKLDTENNPGLSGFLSSDSEDWLRFKLHKTKRILNNIFLFAPVHCLMKGEGSQPPKIYINALFSSLTGPDLENLIQKHNKGLKET